MKSTMHYRGIDDMNHAILRGLQKVPPDIDLIVGIPRSGLLAANMLSLYLNRPLADLEGLAERRLLSTGKRFVPKNNQSIFDSARRILIVDDCISRGTEMKKARAKLTDLGYADRCVFACVYSFPELPHEVDLVFEVVPRPMCFQWSCMHSAELTNYCVDIDGVLCADATKLEDDDSTNYLGFLRDVRPLFAPTTEIGWLVTSRLEKYRGLTEEWLAKHNIRYRNLIMMDHCDQEARRIAGNHAEYKAKAYQESGAVLFIESSEAISRQIHQLTGLPVLCVNPGELYRQPAAEKLEIFLQKSRWWKRRIRTATKNALFKLRNPGKRGPGLGRAAGLP